MKNEHKSTQFPLTERILPSGLSVVEYGAFPGVSKKNYEQMMGHRPDILLPGVFSIADIPIGARVFTCDDSEEARQLSEIKGEEIVLVELVPKKLVDLAIGEMAKAVETLIESSNDLPIVVSAVLNGGRGPFERIESLAPLMQGHNRQDVQVKRSYGDSLVEIQLIIDFKDVADAHVILFEDLGDEDLTLLYLSQRARELGAADVSIVMLMNKIGVFEKKLLEYMKIVGFGIPDLWVGGGVGPDFMNEIGRQSSNVMAMMTPKEYQLRNQLRNQPQALLGLTSV